MNSKLLYALLAFIPITIALNYFSAPPMIVFLAAAASIVPLAELMGDATESLSVKLGETLGGLLNASLQNAPEIIIGGFALHKGLDSVVKASLTGSIIGNILFALGLAMIAGGTKISTQGFNLHLASLNSSLLVLAAIGLIVPAVFHFSSHQSDREISDEIAIALFIGYIASLTFTLVTHKQLFLPKLIKRPIAMDTTSDQSSQLLPSVEAPKIDPSRTDSATPRWTPMQATGVLVMTTVVLAVMSEILTGALEPAAKSLGIGEVFAGVFLLASVGNISGIMNAVEFARKDKMDLVLSITLGAGTQIALLVAPALVLLSHLMGKPMDLLFSSFEVVAITIAVFVGRTLTVDGHSNWLEGFLLVLVYVILGIGFFHA